PTIWTGTESGVRLSSRPESSRIEELLVQAALCSTERVEKLRLDFTGPARARRRADEGQQCFTPRRRVAYLLAAASQSSEPSICVAGMTECAFGSCLEGIGARLVGEASASSSGVGASAQVFSLGEARRFTSWRTRGACGTDLSLRSLRRVGVSNR